MTYCPVKLFPPLLPPFQHPEGHKRTRSLLQFEKILRKQEKAIEQRKTIERAVERAVERPTTSRFPLLKGSRSLFYRMPRLVRER